jgi:predicted O-methyltransferase YrrM
MVETGTYMGDMVAVNAANFERIYSVELSPFYARQAQRLFHKEKHISIV